MAGNMTSNMIEDSFLFCTNGTLLLPSSAPGRFQNTEYGDNYELTTIIVYLRLEANGKPWKNKLSIFQAESSQFHQWRSSFGDMWFHFYELLRKEKHKNMKNKSMVPSSPEQIHFWCLPRCPSPEVKKRNWNECVGNCRHWHLRCGGGKVPEPGWSLCKPYECSLPMVEVNMECNRLVESIYVLEQCSFPFCCVGVAACAQILCIVVEQARELSLRWGRSVFSKAQMTF